MDTNVIEENLPHLLLMVSIIVVAFVGLVGWWKTSGSAKRTVASFALGGLVLSAITSAYLVISAGPIPTPPPPPPPSPPPANPYRLAFDRLGWGETEFEPPTEISIRSTADAALSVSFSIPAEHLALKLQDRLSDREYPYRRMVNPKVKLSNRMKATVSGAFDITETTPRVQAILPNKSTTWVWNIKPKEIGKFPLFLTLSALVEIEGRETAIPVRDDRLVVEVSASLNDRFWIIVDTEPEWILGLLISASLAIWGWSQRSFRPSGKRHP